MSDQKIAIIGAGVAGAIASVATSSYTPTVFEASQASGHTCFKRHKAVLRLRDPATASLLGCQVEAVTVQKMILFKDQLISEPTITTNNLYSLKVSDTIQNKSIQDLGFCQRYIIKDDIVPKGSVEYGCRVSRITPGRIEFENRESFDYDILISTIPLPALLKICDITAKQSFLTKQIGILRGVLPDNFSKVHQTIYIPEHHYKTYRATLQGSDIIFENIESKPFDDVLHLNNERKELLKLFGLSWDCASKWTSTYQVAGKIIPIDDTARRSLIYRLTDEFNIFSFGRYAIWKQVRIDNLVADIEKIKKMIRSKYETSKERT